MSSACPGDAVIWKVNILFHKKRWFGERPGRRVGEPDTPDCEEVANVEEDDIEEEEEEEEEGEEYSEEEYSEEEE